MSASPEDPRWQALTTRNPQADGCFLYAVTSTGVFCHPSCKSRLPKAENVLFFDTVAAAQAAGFRPCKRCQPTLPPGQEDQQRIETLCALLSAHEEPLPLAELAAHVGLSPYHTHRLFKRWTGLTPKAWAKAQRAARLQRALHTEASVTAAFYAAGYGSSGAFYAEASKVLGMTPKRFQQGGSGETLRYTLQASSLGQVLAAQGSRGLCALFLGDTVEELEQALCKRFPRAQCLRDDASFAALLPALLRLLEDPTSPSELPLELRGTAFQQRVWQCLTEIPPGTTLTYGELAARIGQPRAVRAVGRACGANPVAIAVPCHRAIAASGALTGYRWGLARKQALLARESPRKSG